MGGYLRTGEHPGSIAFQHTPGLYRNAHQPDAFVDEFAQDLRIVQGKEIVDGCGQYVYESLFPESDSARRRYCDSQHNKILERAQRWCWRSGCHGKPRTGKKNRVSPERVRRDPFSV